MDITSIYELGQHFVQNASHIAPVLRDAYQQITETTQNISTALCDKNLSSSERAYHLTKISLSTAGLAFSTATLNVAGMAGFAIPEIEEIRELNKKGAALRSLDND